MKSKEPKNAKETKLPEIIGSRKAQNIGRRPSGRYHANASLQEVRNNFITILQLGEKSKGSNARSSVKQAKWQKISRQNKRIPRGNQTPEKCNSRNISIKYGAKKNSLGLVQYKHLSRAEKFEIISYINWLYHYTEFSVNDILQGIGINRNKRIFYLSQCI